jgi:hypothetical protein
MIEQGAAVSNWLRELVVERLRQALNLGSS